MRFGTVLVSCWVLWTDLTKSSLARLTCLQGSEGELAKYRFSDDGEGCRMAKGETAWRMMP